MEKLTGTGIRAALEKARRDNAERDARSPEARAATRALQEWAEGLPADAGEDEQRRHEDALRRFIETHDGPLPG